MVFVPRLDRSPIERSAPVLSGFKMLGQRPLLLSVLVIRFFSAAGQGAVYTFLPLYGVSIGISSAQVGILLGVNVLLIAILQRPGGSLADRTRPVLLMVGGALAGLTVAGMPIMPHFLDALVMNIFMGIANGIAVPAALVLAGREGREFRQIESLKKSVVSSPPSVMNRSPDSWGRSSRYVAIGDLLS